MPPSLSTLVPPPPPKSHCSWRFPAGSLGACHSPHLDCSSCILLQPNATLKAEPTQRLPGSLASSEARSSFPCGSCGTLCSGGQVARRTEGFPTCSTAEQAHLFLDSLCTPAGHQLLKEGQMSKGLLLYGYTLSQFVHIFSFCFPAPWLHCGTEPGAVTHTGRGHVTLVSPAQALNSCANRAWSTSEHWLP